MKSIKITYIILLFTMTSCAEEWLDIKQDKSMVVPQSLADLQALLDNSNEFNFYCTPMLGTISTDNFYLLDEDWNAISSAEQKNSYIWAEDIYEGSTSYSYNNPYQAVLLANLALEGLVRINPQKHEQQSWDNIKGSALFYRSWMFYLLAQTYCTQYVPSTANIDFGIPLRLESDVNLTSKRSSVQQTYDQIIQDTKQALELLPLEPVIKTRPGQAAVNGLLAKVYLQMENYPEALKYARAALEIQKNLLDFNILDSTADYPFPKMNDEVIFHSTLYPFSSILNSHHIDETLYESYQENDLRQDLLFWNDGDRKAFRGSYDGSSGQFNGIATDEMYLIVAECEARANNSQESLEALNTLLATRWVQGTFESIELEEDLLDIILSERRKSLLFRGVRWMDLRRLNNDGDRVITLTRTVNGSVYTLPPNDNRYVFPIPDDAINASGMAQNPR